MTGATRRATRRRLGEDEKRARRVRIFERLRQGYWIAEIAKREGLTPQRIRQIVSEARHERSEAEQAELATIETEGLKPLLRRAARMVVRNDPPAIRALAKIVDRLDRLVPAADAPGAK
jgi:transposase-like protein